MENQIKYVQVSADNEEQCKAFESLMVPYIAEIDQHSDSPLSKEFQQKWIDSIIAMQGPQDRHLELCYVGNNLVGFLYGKIDHEGHKGFIKPGYGYIMEFYVCPQYRRKGYGKRMFLHMEHLFRDDGAKRMYLTADPVTGKPFWEAMGFANTGEQSPENQQDIYEKDVSYPNFENGKLLPLSKETVAVIAQWEYEAPYDAYSFKGHHDWYLLDESNWGKEQFCLVDDGILLGQVACQYEGKDLWVGWSMAPQLCGNGNGAAFVTQCIQELRCIKAYTGRMCLRVSARNKRAIKAYQKAGFQYLETIQDEIAFSDNMEDFWVMVTSSPITIREAITETDVAAFWEQLHVYHKRDIFPDPDHEDLEYFLGSEYHDHMMKIHGRPQDRCFFLFFHRNGQDIGFAMPVIFTSEDGKCFIMEFCVYPEFRGNGTGKECARVLLDWAKENGARYAELNHGSNERRRHFWESVGFIENGVDEWGEPLMILPPAEDLPITVEVLSAPEDWQLRKLENGFLMEIGESTATEEKQERLAKAIRDGKITFFIAKRGYRAVGMCSVAKCFSTFACSDTGVFDDFYIEPVFRRKGIAGQLTQAAQKWSEENGIASLSVTCAPCDEGLYQALGFNTRLGSTFAHII